MGDLHDPRFQLPLPGLHRTFRRQILEGGAAYVRVDELERGFIWHGRWLQEPQITGVPGHSFYRVVAVDEQGNVKISPKRRVFVPREDNDLAPQGSYTRIPMEIPDVNAFFGQYTTLGIGDTLTYNYVQTAGQCRPFELIGPGGGDWTVAVSVNGLPHSTIDGSLTPLGDRQVLFSFNLCDSTLFEFDVTAATTEFGIDGVVSKAASG